MINLFYSSYIRGNLVIMCTVSPEFCKFIFHVASLKIGIMSKCNKLSVIRLFRLETTLNHALLLECN